MRMKVNKSLPISIAALCLVILSGCAVHKDLLYTFTAVGHVACIGACDSRREVKVRVVDTGLDYKRKKMRFEIAGHITTVGVPFRFDFDYFWGYTGVSGGRRPSRLVTVEALADGCESASLELNLDTVQQQDAHFTLAANSLVIECAD